MEPENPLLKYNQHIGPALRDWRHIWWLPLDGDEPSIYDGGVELAGEAGTKEEASWAAGPNS
jgi:hypothetical protein